MADKWLIDYKVELDKKSFQELMHEYPAEKLAYLTVHPLRGKNGSGNVEEASEPIEYP